MSSLALLVGSLAYVGGYWLHALHELSGAVEPGAPPSLIHWLRDSTLLVPVVGLAVYVGLVLARRLAGQDGSDEQHRPGMTDHLSAAAIVALVVSAPRGPAAPLHGVLFGGHEAHVAEQAVASHMLADGLAALPANVLIAAMVLALVGGRLWVDRSPAARSVRHALGARRRGLIAAIGVVVSVSSGTHLAATPTAAAVPFRPCPATAPGQDLRRRGDRCPHVAQPIRRQ